jgi:hypothetical protein
MQNLIQDNDIIFSPVIQENIRAERAVLPGAAGKAAPGGGVQGRAGGEAAHHCSTQH